MRSYRSAIMPDMHGLGLARDLSFCLVDGRPIFLDLRSDSYFMLGDPETAVLKQAICGDVPGTRHLSRLEMAGVLERRPHPSPLEPARICRPEGSILESAAPDSASPGATLRLAGELALIKTRLRLGGLAALINALRRHRSDAPSDRRPVHQAASRFAACRRWIPMAPCCLPDSLALAFRLARSGLAAHLVLGVKLHPFAAHAWVQHEDLVLNDGLDGPLDFTPILVV